MSPKLEVPAHIPRPPYADSGIMPDWDPNPQIHDAAGIEKMRAAGRLAAQASMHARGRGLGSDKGSLHDACCEGSS